MDRFKKLPVQLRVALVAAPFVLAALITDLIGLHSNAVRALLLAVMLVCVGLVAGAEKGERKPRGRSKGRGEAGG